MQKLSHLSLHLSSPVSIVPLTLTALARAAMLAPPTPSAVCHSVNCHKSWLKAENVAKRWKLSAFQWATTNDDCYFRCFTLALHNFASRVLNISVVPYPVPDWLSLSPVSVPVPSSVCKPPNRLVQSVCSRAISCRLISLCQGSQGQWFNSFILRFSIVPIYWEFLWLFFLSFLFSISWLVLSRLFARSPVSECYFLFYLFVCCRREKLLPLRLSTASATCLFAPKENPILPFPRSPVLPFSHPSTVRSY